jgi:hypothetical protein
MIVDDSKLNAFLGLTTFFGIETYKLGSMSKTEIESKLPSSLTLKGASSDGKFAQYKDANGVERIRFDGPHRNVDFDHVHLFDEKGNPLDKNLNVVDRTSSDAHIRYDDPNDPDNPRNPKNQSGGGASGGGILSEQPNSYIEPITPMAPIFELPPMYVPNFYIPIFAF